MTAKPALMVKTQSHDYPIFIQASPEKADLVSQIVPYIRGHQVLIVSNDTIAPLYLADMQAGLMQADFVVQTCILPDGEAYKNQQSIDHIYDVLLEHHFARDCTLIALGGGVIGDMVGFAAASYMRGVDFIQVPTTLLSQVDSSVGGKTGINHRRGKNMIGAFWQPRCVLADMTTFATLPKREFAAGMAEVIKYALIMDASFLDWLEENHVAINAQDGEILAQMVRQSCQFKAQIVAEDERESGRRALLNFGHTFGHVIETHQGYGVWLHGEAVAAGMVQAAMMSQQLGYIGEDDVARIKKVLALFHLPTQPPAILPDEALDLMGHDKKVKQGQIRLILLKKIGQAFVTSDFQMNDLQKVLSAFTNSMV